MTTIKFRIIILTTVFLSIIAIPFINDELYLIKDIESSENRQMTSKPLFDINCLDPFPKKFEKYYNDHFSIRSILVKYYNLINLKIFKKSPIPDQVIIGNDGWLFLAGNENDSYKGINRLTQSELEQFKQEFEYRKQYLNHRGCKFYLLIAPIKASIYSDKIPNNQYRLNNQTWGEQLIEYLNTKSAVKPIDIYNSLRANKNKDLLYYKLDNHWNQLGAFIAATEVLKYIHRDFPEISTVSLDEYNIIKKSNNNRGNIIKMFSNTVNYTDSFFQLIPKSGFIANNVPSVGYPVVKGFPYTSLYEIDKEIKNSKIPKILIISDSFGENIFPFLAEKFSRSVKIFDGWQYKLNEEIIKSENPDIVLVIVLESNIRNILNFQSIKNKK